MSSFLRVILVLGVAAGAARAQNTGTVLGHLTDSTGAILPGATVNLRNTGTGYSRDAVSDSQGDYIAAQLPIGTYNAQASATGLQSKLIQGIVLSLNQNLRVDFSLAVGQLQQTVTVEGDNIGQVDTHSSTLTSQIDQTRILNLPLNGRDPASLLLTVPGVSTLSVPTSPGISGDTATINGTTLRHKSS